MIFKNECANRLEKKGVKFSMCALLVRPQATILGGWFSSGYMLKGTLANRSIPRGEIRTAKGKINANSILGITEEARLLQPEKDLKSYFCEIQKAELEITFH